MCLNPLTRIAVTLLNIYQQYISKNFPCACRFYPNCSEYAKQAILRHGPAPGIIIACRRLLRCHPFSRSQGFDPVR
ncbi:MAG: membrane protein insertion efficiency factor YidD [Candidatus Omnitrophica bacterium]|nr:membrane protein insertion efficiency factor YidD [Candidatus Omnitrophota bacterium]MBU1872032.1 membrane protein insertion efficiency factor YidD [Candidatus Omnitrophota bacterium]